MKLITYQPNISRKSIRTNVRYIKVITSIVDGTYELFEIPMLSREERQQIEYPSFSFVEPFVDFPSLLHIKSLVDKDSEAVWEKMFKEFGRIQDET